MFSYKNACLFAIIVLLTAQTSWTQDNDNADIQNDGLNPESRACRASYETYSRAREARNRACPSENLTSCEQKISECTEMLENIFPATTSGRINTNQVESFEEACPGVLGSFSGRRGGIKQRMDRLLQERKENIDNAKKDYDKVKQRREAKIKKLEEKLDKLTNGTPTEGDKEKSLSEMSIGELDAKASELTNSNREMEQKTVEYMEALNGENGILKKLNDARKNIATARRAYRDVEQRLVIQCDETVEGELATFDRRFRARRSNQSRRAIRAREKRKLYARCMARKANTIALSNAREDYTQTLNTLQQEINRLQTSLQDREQQYQMELQEVEQNKRRRLLEIQQEKQRRISELSNITKELAEVKSPSREEERLGRELEEASEALDEQTTTIENLELRLGGVISNEDPNTELLADIYTDQKFESAKQIALDECCIPNSSNGEPTISYIKSQSISGVSGASNFCRTTTTPNPDAGNGGSPPPSETEAVPN